MPDDPPVSTILRQLGVKHRVFRHSGKVASLDQAARERGQRPEQIVRSIVFRLGKEQFLMVLVAGPNQLSWPKLRRHIGRSRLTMASESEVLQQTGYRVGTVSPFGLAHPMRILIDRGVLEEKEVSIGAGSPDTGIILFSKDLKGALPAAEIAQLL